MNCAIVACRRHPKAIRYGSDMHVKLFRESGQSMLMCCLVLLTIMRTSYVRRLQRKRMGMEGATHDCMHSNVCKPNRTSTALPRYGPNHASHLPRAQTCLHTHATSRPGASNDASHSLTEDLDHKSSNSACCCHAWYSSHTNSWTWSSRAW